MNGPTWMGGWAGVPQHDICAGSTKTDSGMWKNMAGECEVLIIRLFDSWRIGWYVPLFILMVMWGCATVNTGVKYVLKKPKQTTIVIHKGSLRWVSPVKELPADG